MRKFKIFFNITIVLLLLLPLGTAFSTQAVGYAVQPDVTDEVMTFHDNDPDQIQNGLEPEVDTAGDARRATVGDSHVSFDPFKGGSYFFIPGERNEFCFTADTFATGLISWVNNIWLRFPVGWVVKGNVYVRGQPWCENTGYFTNFSWSYGIDIHEIRINHQQFHPGGIDHCSVTYCMQLIPGSSISSADVSWFMDLGDVHSDINVCSNDGYLPEGHTRCGYRNDPASIPSSVSRYSSWERIPNMPAPARNRPAAVGLDGKIYLIGGETDGTGGRAERVAIFDPARNTWSLSKVKMPIPARNICAVTYKEEIYVIGGQDSKDDYLDKIQVYNPTDDSWWEVKWPLPEPVVGAGCAILDKRLYVFGGQTKTGYSTKSFVAEMGHFGFFQTGSMNSPARAWMASTIVNGKIYAIGGRSSGAPDLAQVEVYDPSTGKWTKLRDMNIPRNAPGAYSIDNDLIVCGGGDSIHHNTCEVFDVSQIGKQYWVYLRSFMQTARRTFAYTNLGKDLYAIGGWNNGRLISAERMVNEPPRRMKVIREGSGTVTSSPAGINCGATCAADFAYLTTVTLTAAPAAGWTFTGWSGACTGIVTCTVTMSQARSVTATFTSDVGPTPPPPPLPPSTDFKIYLPLITH
jgi:uncharacterized repeat protein (TIGR02543 family)